MLCSLLYIFATKVNKKTIMSLCHPHISVSQKVTVGKEDWCICNEFSLLRKSESGYFETVSFCVPFSSTCPPSKNLSHKKTQVLRAYSDNDHIMITGSKGPDPRKYNTAWMPWKEPNTTWKNVYRNLRLLEDKWNPNLIWQLSKSKNLPKKAKENFPMNVKENF